ncbi:hypothetical protein ACQEVC_44320 [Plantactinospora sp. CA-294935]
MGDILTLGWSAGLEEAPGVWRVVNKLVRAQRPTPPLTTQPG